MHGKPVPSISRPFSQFEDQHVITEPAGFDKDSCTDECKKLLTSPDKESSDVKKGFPVWIKFRER
jgi:hypothetical protein